jgi:hypothetical protein
MTMHMTDSYDFVCFRAAAGCSAASSLFLEFLDLSV